MAANCGVCSGVCADDVGSIRCSGVCDRVFHLKCIKTEGIKTRNVSKEWKCDDCLLRKVSSLPSSNKSSTSTTSITKEFLKSTIEAFKKEVFAELKSYSEQMEDFRKSLQFMSDRVDESNTLMAETRKEYAEIRKQNEFLLQENKKLCTSVDNLQARLTNLEQYTRRNNIEISGIPETPKEDINTILKDVGTVLGEELRDGQVSAAHRIPTYTKGRTPSIVVQFQSRAQRDAWISSYRRKKTLSADEVNKSFPGSRVFVNEHLCPENKRFLSQLKDRCRDISFKFAWFRDGKFYVRKSEGERCHKVLNLEDLNKLK